MKPIAFNATHCFAGTYGTSVWRSAWSDLNVSPRINGLLNPLQPNDDLTLQINLSDILVSDPDNDFPDDFTLKIKPGAEYTISGNVITISPEYSGILYVPLIVNDGRSDSNEFLAAITVSPITAISESNDGFLFFPNPTNHKINFKITQDINSYSLFDLAGRKVTGKIEVSQSSETLSLDVSNFPPGVYLMQLNGEKKHIHKFVKY